MQSEETSPISDPLPHAILPWQNKLAAACSLATLDVLQLNQCLLDGSLPNAELLRRCGPLAPDVTAALADARLFVRGDWPQLRADPLPSEPPPNRTAQLIWLERAFFRLQALKRTPHADAERRSWANVVSQAAANLGAPQVRAMFQVESAADKMRLGLYRQCLVEVAAARVLLCDDSLYWLFRCATIEGTCHQALGDYPAAREALAIQERVARTLDSPYFLLAQLRRHISLLVESEQYALARALITQATEQFRHAGLRVTHALFLHEKVRLALATEDAPAAAAAFAELDQATGQFPGTLTSIAEQCELDLRRQDLDQALDRVREALWQTQLAGDIAAQCVIHLVLAQALLQRGARAEAIQTLNSTIVLSEANGYRKTLCSAEFLRASLLLQEGRTEEARLSLDRAGRIATKLGLPVRTALYHAVSYLLSPDAGHLRALLEVQSHSIQALRILLTRFGFSAEHTVRVRPWHGPESLVPLLSLIEGSTHALSYFQHERLLVRTSEGGPKIVEVGGEDLFRQVVRAFLTHPNRALTLEAVHAAIWPRVRFRPDRHAPLCHAHLRKARSWLSPHGLEVVFRPARRAYELSASVPFRCITVERSERTPRHSLSGREEEVLALIKEARTLSTQQLRAALGVTRQTLHPMLRKLIAQGLIGMRKRGRSSFYFVME